MNAVQMHQRARTMHHRYNRSAVTFTAPSLPSALGLRVRSGRAIAVVLNGAHRGPTLLDCRVIPLADPALPESTQPYHVALVDHQLRDMGAAKPLIAAVHRTARRSVAAMLKVYLASGWRIDRAALVVGSLIDPALVANQHMRAHALEGQLFRTALEQALTAEGLRCSFLVERTAYADAAKSLPLPEEEVKLTIKELGRTCSGHWRADEKLAALGAWTLLRSVRSS
jgi:hypothetical protein